MSPESRFVGYMVLGFGILAVIAVIILALGSRPDKDADEAKTQALAKELMEPPQVTPPPPKKELYFDREPDFDAAKMEGDWQAMVGKYTAVLQIKNGSYQIIMAQPDPNAPRIYSTGSYKVLEDIVMLTPRLDWPAPKTADSTVAYEILTRAAFPMLVAFDGGKLLWQHPPQSERRVLVGNNSPLFMSEDVHYIVWKKLD